MTRDECFEQIALPMVLAHEGGYVNHPRDPGGPTNKGITQDTYDRYRRTWSLPRRGVREITLAEVGAIYRSYWDASKCTLAPWNGAAVCLFDVGVNSGRGHAVQDYREASRTLGSATNEAWVDFLCTDRLAFLRRLTTWKTFGRGWTARVKQTRATALGPHMDERG